MDSTFDSASTGTTVRPDLLMASAPLAHQWAGKLCSGAGGSASCAGYHGLRPYWRLLDLVTTPEHHPFYTERIRMLAEAGGARDVLISGCADFSQLACVLQACRMAGVEPRVTVVDRCATPLALCRWYALQEKTSIVTACSDIREFRSDEEFDLICTHSFLSWVPHDQRVNVISGWYGLLRPGGQVLTVSRLRRPPEDPGTSGHYDKVETDAFCALVAERAGALRDQLAVAPEQLVSWARQYHEAHGSYGVFSQSDLERDFREAGFQTEVIRLDAPRRKEWRRAPHESSSVLYLGVAATRPE